MFKELILKLRSALATLTLNDEQKKNIEDQIKALETEAEKKTAANPTQSAEIKAQGLDEATRQLITSLEGQVKGLSDALAAETKNRKDQADAIAAQAAKDRAKKISDFIDKMKREGRIIAAQEERDRKNLDKDYDEWEKEISARAPNPAIKKSDPSKANQTDKDRKDDPPANDYFKNPKSYIEAAIEEFKSSTN